MFTCWLTCATAEIVIYQWDGVPLKWCHVSSLQKGLRVLFCWGYEGFAHGKYIVGVGCELDKGPAGIWCLGTPRDLTHPYKDRCVLSLGFRVQEILGASRSIILGRIYPHSFFSYMWQFCFPNVKFIHFFVLHRTWKVFILAFDCICKYGLYVHIVTQFETHC